MDHILTIQVAANEKVKGYHVSFLLLLIKRINQIHLLGVESTWLVNLRIRRREITAGVPPTHRG